MHTSPTAFITGASAGLGMEFARQLAAQGYDLILTARRKDRLDELAGRLQSHNVSIEVIPADLCQPADIQRLCEYITNQPNLEILVNNAGFGTKGRFQHVDPQKLDAMAQVHMTAPILLSRAALSVMLPRQRGNIINVASMAGFFPYRSVLYGSSKAFLISFSQSLDDQLAGTGVHVQALCPGFTRTEFHSTDELRGFNHHSIPKLLWLTSEQVVRHSLNDLRRHRQVSIPGWQYRFIALFARNSLLTAFIRGVARYIFNKDGVA